MTARLALPASLRWLDLPPHCVETGLAGHVVVIVLWQLDHEHSRQALLDVGRLHQDAAARPVVALTAQVPPAAAGVVNEARVRRALGDLPGAHTIDAERDLLRQLGATALPFVAIVDVDGTLVFRGAGVPHRRRLDDALEALGERAAQSGTAALVPFLPLAAGLVPLAPNGLTVHGGRLWLAAAGHRRVYALQPAAAANTLAVDASFGSGVAAAVDGTGSRAGFLRPAGMLSLGERVLVADVDGHTLRAIEPASGDVTTWCGTGRRSTDRHGGAYGRDQGLCTPNGLAEQEGLVVVAQPAAGQLWQFDVMTRVAAAWLGGDGQSAVGGPFRAPVAALAHGDRLYVADAEANEVVVFDLGHLQRLHAIPLRRPQALLAVGDRVLVAASGEPAVLAIEGDAVVPCFTAAHGLVEPVALAVWEQRLWIADAGADGLFVGDPAGGGPLTRVTIAALPAADGAIAAPSAQLGTSLRLREHSDVALRCAVPAAWQGVCEIDVVDVGEPTLAVARHAVSTAAEGWLPFLVPTAAAAQGAWRVRVRHRDGRCDWLVPVEIAAEGALAATVA
jgi:hypothetical protein